MSRINSSLKRSKERLEKENASLKKKISLLEESSITDEDRLILGIVKEMPFSIWACDINFKIKLWSGKCKEFYGYSKEQVLGKNYLDIFIAEDERQASKIDCKDIINKGKVFNNCYAEDKTQDGKTLKLLTNCVRVDNNGQYLQAEMGLEVSDFAEKKEKHTKVIREGIKHIEEEKAKRKFELIITEMTEMPLLLETKRNDINKKLDEKILHYQNLLSENDTSLNRKLCEEELNNFINQKRVFNEEISSLQSEMKDLIKNKTFKDKFNKILNQFSKL